MVDKADDKAKEKEKKKKDKKGGKGKNKKVKDPKDEFMSDKTLLE